MSMFNLISVFSACFFTFRENLLKTLFSLDFLFIIDIFYTKGESIIPHLLCCDAFVARSKATWQSHVSAESL